MIMEILLKQAEDCGPKALRGLDHAAPYAR